MTAETDTDDPETADVESVFEETDRFGWATTEFRGTHTREECSITYEYVIERGTEFVEETVRYYVGGDLLRERANWWAIDPRTKTTVHSQEPIEEFCRDRHASDSVSGFEYLDQRGRIRPPNDDQQREIHD